MRGLATWLASQDSTRLQAWAAIASVLLSFALLAFTAVQVAIMAWSERARRRERSLDEAERKDVALAVLRAEEMRAWFTVRRWSDSDLITESIAGTLRPEEALPQQPALLAQSAAQLGVLPAQLANNGATLAEQAALSVTRFNVLVEAAAQHTRYASGEIDLEALRQRHGAMLDDRAANIRELMGGAAASLQDAVNQSDETHTPRDARMYPGSESGFGKELEAQYGTKPLPAFLTLRSISDGQPSGWALRAYDAGVLP